MTEKEKLHLVYLLRNADSAKTELDGAIAKGGKVMHQVQAKQKFVEIDIKSAFKALNKAVLIKPQTISFGQSC